ncbi:MAG: transcription elongation factor [Candidatus Manganitrophaceae bacterium]|nr:MAG: transcription elongation factor [Candidatus Manganitrophaceae bacterium]
MPEKKTIQQARKAKRQGKKPSTQAGAFVKEEIEHVRKGKHGARSTKQAIAIGLSKARRAGVNVPKKGKAAAKKKTAKKSTSSSRKRKPSAKRSRATTRALKREGRQAVSHKALSRQGKQAARRRKTA